MTMPPSAEIAPLILIRHLIECDEKPEINMTGETFRAVSRYATGKQLEGEIVTVVSQEAFFVSHPYAFDLANKKGWNLKLYCRAATEEEIGNAGDLTSAITVFVQDGALAGGRDAGVAIEVTP